MIVLALTGSVLAEPVHKPSAPVEVSIESKPLVGGYAVMLIATPTRAVPSIELEVFGSNTRAIRLYERLGFAYEGVRRKARKLDGAYEDLIVMALL